MTTPAIGPAHCTTVISRHYRASIEAWCQFLGQRQHSTERLSEAAARSLGFAGLAGQAYVWLANQANEPWLRIIDAPTAMQRVPFENYGWLSLEISVDDVDLLYEHIKNSPFSVIGKPANLDVSDDIRAMQVSGLDGEVLYLTEVRAPVPPFKLPTARFPVDKLFISVATVPDRDHALAFYQRFAGTEILKFDTKITVINAALGLEQDHRHPVATVQLADNTLVELDQIADLKLPDSSATMPMSGILSVTFEVESLPKDAKTTVLDNGPYAGRRSCLVDGGAGKRMELVERA